MMREGGRKAAWLAGVAAAALLVGRVAARGPEDDLTLVKRAVGDEPAGPQEAKEAKASPRGEAKWLKVRINETKGKRAKVVVNLPLSLVRALGDDVPIHWGHRHGDGHRRAIRLSEILEALDAGQELVQIESDDATVRVWVE
jgi:hypothetical protein